MLYILKAHADGIENNAGKLPLIDMEELICFDPCRRVCLRFRWQFIVMNLYIDPVSFGLEPNTTASEAQDLMSLQSNWSCCHQISVSYSQTTAAGRLGRASLDAVKSATPACVTHRPPHYRTLHHLSHSPSNALTTHLTWTCAVLK